MNSFQGQIPRRIIILQLSLLFCVALQARTFAQNAYDDFNIRVGNGSSMTLPSSRSIFLSIPGKQYAEVTFPVIFVENSVTFLEEERRLEFIVGLSPMFRFELNHMSPKLSFEAGVGVNLVSFREMGGRHLGSNFLFSPTLTAGFEVPWTNGLLGIFYMFRHLSNAGIFQVNDGINFQYIVFAVNFKNM